MRFILATLFLSVVFTSKAQQGYSQPKIGIYYGKIIHKKTLKPIPYTKIVILNKKDSTIVSGGLSNETGNFKITNIPTGTYIAKITSFGFKPVFIDSVVFSIYLASVNAGEISMQEDIDLLNEVVVTAEEVEIETAIDKKVFNVDKQITTKGGTALDALQNVPSITVDVDGNVSLRGSANVTILIDGRPSSLSGAGRQGVLTSIPASSIEKIEIITNPSAKYDPDGMSGIINIILKKNKLRGFNGSVEAGIGNGINYNGAVNIAYRNDKFNMYGTYSINHYYGYRNFYQERETWIPTYNKLIQDREGTHLRHSNMVKFGTDFYLNPKNTIGFSLSGNLSENNRTGNMKYLSYDSTTLIDSWRRINDNPSNRDGFDSNIYYEKKFNKKDQLLTIDANYSIGEFISNGFFVNDSLDLNGLPTVLGYEQQRNESPETYTTANARVDYFYPTKKGKIELGLKSTLRLSNSKFKQETFNDDQQLFTEDDSLTNSFNYDEQVHAAYFIYGINLKKYKFQVGLRAEQAFVGAEVEGDSVTYRNDYFALYPSAHIKKPLGRGKELSLSYSRRVNRPHRRSINPFPRYTDPLNLRRGNPYLNPEFINSVELGYMSYTKKLTVTSSLYYRYMTNLIKRVKIIDSTGIGVTSWQNLDNGHFIGLELVFIYKPYKWWRMMISGNIAQNFLNSDDAELNNSGLNYTAFFNQTFSLKNDWSIQNTAYFMSPFILPQGRSFAMYSTNVAVKKSVLKRKLSLSLSLQDVFNTRFFALEVNEAQDFSLYSKWKWQSRRIMFTATYAFGNQTTQPRKRKRDKEDDGGGNDMGM
ncbi:MAG TPA: TonB-dependent receptor [Crocinitomix sp.]|nr:TonB-dependent receptor [Crocinitomix sp.]